VRRDGVLRRDRDRYRLGRLTGMDVTGPGPVRRQSSVARCSDPDCWFVGRPVVELTVRGEPGRLWRAGGVLA
jgi:hypothetical protein